MIKPVLKPLALVAVPLLVATMGCSPEKDTSSKGSTSSCAVKDLPLKTPGQLTVATDSPAYDPWFADNKPSNGKGYESAVAYAVAKQLGFTPDQVKWIVEPFNNSYAPGDKKFDFDINQISITPARAQKVDFSDGYYTAAQAVVALKKANLKPGSLADLKDLKLGAQTGTTSLTVLRDDIKPSHDPVVFMNTNAAKQALLNGQVDAIIADLPTALYITAAEIPGSTVVGQFTQVSGQPEQFGMLMQKGSGLKTCLDQALAKVKSSGELADLEKQWLSTNISVPVIK